MGTCPYYGASVTVRAEFVNPAPYNDDVAAPGEVSIQFDRGTRTFQYVCPECAAILVAGTHEWAREPAGIERDRPPTS